MKKILSLCLVILVIIIGGVTIFLQTRPEEIILENKIEEKLSAYNTDLTDSLVTLNNKENIITYLTQWAQNKDISVSSDRSKNVIYNIPSSKKYKSADPVLIICSYNSDDMENSIQAVASALYIAKNNEKTGKLDVIFTDASEKSNNSLSNIDKKYLKDNTKVFCISSTEKGNFIAQTAATSEYTFISSVNYTKTKNNKAYRITINGLTSGMPDEKFSYPNPIKQLGDLLATLKTNALIYELADFNGGDTASTYPAWVNCTIVINENDEQKILRKIDNNIERYLGKYQDDYPELNYSYEEVKTPSKVLTQKSLNKFVSTLYTLFDGTYEEDSKHNVTALSNIGKIHLGKKICTVNAYASSLNEVSLEEIGISYQTICSLSDIRYQKTHSVKGWSLDEDCDFSNQIMKAYEDYNKSELAYISSLTPQMAYQIEPLIDKNNIVEINIDLNSQASYTGCIIQYLMNLVSDENK